MNSIDTDSDSERDNMNIPPIQSVEDFWGVELSSKTRKLDWGTEDTDDDIDVEKTLELRQACLGAAAKDGERNVVQVTTENDEGEEVTHTILSMRVGLNEQRAGLASHTEATVAKLATSLFLTLHPPVALELVKGNGPIHIVGQVTETLGPLMDSDTDSSEDEAEISSPEVKALQASSGSKKRPADSPTKKQPAPKVAKLEEKESDDDEMETSEEEEEDDSEEEEDESEEEEEEEEEETKPPPRKQQQTNGKLKGKPSKPGDKGVVFKTPQIGKKPPLQQRGTQSAPTTPKMKVDKKKGGAPPSASTGGKITSSTAPGALSTDEIKKKLLKMSSNVPKKLEKFNNFVSNSFKVKDDATKKHLWEFVQKNRAEK